MPATTAQAKSPTGVHHWRVSFSPRVEVASQTARAVRSDTSAIASLARDSPSRIVVMRLGSPILRATAVAATASGGATMAPTAKAREKGIGRIAYTTSATPRAVNRTRPTERLMIVTLCAATS